MEFYGILLSLLGYEMIIANSYPTPTYEIVIIVIIVMSSLAQGFSLGRNIQSSLIPRPQTFSTFLVIIIIITIIIIVIIIIIIIVK